MPNLKPFPFSLQPITEEEGFMLEALKQAWKGFLAEEIPIGAVIVHDGKVIARGYNQVEMLKDATAHAEMLAVTSASSALENWRLTGATLYTTVEPCVMCLGAMLLSRVSSLVWAAPDLRHGALGSWVNLVEKPHPTHAIEVKRGPYGDESAYLLREFFRLRRKGADVTL